MTEKAIHKNIYAMSNKSLLLVSEKNVVDHLGTFSLNYLSVSLHDDNVVCEKELINGAVILRFHGKKPPAEDEIRAEVKLTIYADLSAPILVISSVGQFDLFLDLKLNFGVRYEFFDRYFSYLKKRPSLKLINNDKPLYFLGDGAIKLDLDNMLLQIKPGYSRIFLCEPDDEGNIYFYKSIFKRAYVSAIYSDSPQDLIYKKLCRKKKEAFSKKSLDNITNEIASEFKGLVYQCRENCYYFQGESGGFWWKSGKIEISEMCDAFHFLIAIKEKHMAKMFAEFLYSLLECFSDIPLLASYDVEEYLLAVNTYNSSSLSAYFVLCEYEKEFSLPHDKRLDELADSIISNSSKLMKGGMMPFSGLEDYFTDGGLTSSQRFDGSVISTIMFLAFAKKFLSGVKKKTAKIRKFETLINFSISRFTYNFYDLDTLLLNAVNRSDKVIFPHKIAGLCDSCGNASLLTNRKRHYFCDKCNTEVTVPTVIFKQSYDKAEAFLLGRYLQAGLFDESLNINEIYPERLSFNGLIMSIKCYRNNKDVQEKFLNKLIERCNEDKDKIEFNVLCRILGDIILYAKRR